MTQRQPKYGEIWIYDLSDTLEQEIAQLDALDGLAAAVGVPLLNDDDVQIVPVSNVHDLGLSAFLEMAYGVAQADMADMSDTFAALTGSIAILRSGAFPEEGISRTPNDRARLVAVLSEEMATPTGVMPLTSDGSQGNVDPVAAVTGGKAKSDARVGGMIAMYALLLLFALVGLMVWVAG